jgi:peptidoglycan/LPS O-acetylase OafA/YrhL
VTALTYALAEPIEAPPTRVRRRFPLLGHVPALDGLRGLSLVVIVVFHFVGHHAFKGGWLGVDIFFGLSGFLITALVLDELRVHGRIRLSLFYARRACRLLPALFAMLAVWVVMLLLFHDRTWFAATPSGDGTGRTVDVGGALKDVGLALLYVANWNVIDGGMEAPLSHLWSLAVEEQFYLVWPGLLVLLLSVSHHLRLAVVALLIAASAALPLLLGSAAHDHIYFGTDTRAVGMMGGAFAALVWHRRAELGPAARWGSWRAIAALLLMGVVLWWSTNALPLVVAPAGMMLLVTQVIPRLADGRGVLARALSNPVLTWAGRRSYGLYLWHYLWATWTHPLGLLVGMPLGIAGAVACAELSWRYVERPALRYGKRFAVSSAPQRSLRPA